MIGLELDKISAVKTDKKQAVPNRRSDCPVSCALDILGDRWTMVIIRDFMLAGKTEYGELLRSDEGISTNILADRLARLHSAEIVLKRPIDGKRNAYLLTERGIGLVPLVVEMMIWAGDELCTGMSSAACEEIKANKSAFVDKVQGHLRAKLAGDIPLAG